MGGTKEEEEENEGLALLIPDIQETAKIVHSATEKLREHDGKILHLASTFPTRDFFCNFGKGPYGLSDREN